ncbi:hypothetical protein [Streptomyces sp. NPDC089919]|uniref:hypothetical protein n=1 Tax=Streptomyces sp. NPDC089919 TaxID=3155188 RepID=UPI00343668DD
MTRASSAPPGNYRTVLEHIDEGGPAREALTKAAAMTAEAGQALEGKPGSVWTELPRPVRTGAEPVGQVRLGYPRASTARQSLDAQLDSLGEAGVTPIYSEKGHTPWRSPHRGAAAGRGPRVGSVVQVAGTVSSKAVPAER